MKSYVPVFANVPKLVAVPARGLNDQPCTELDALVILAIFTAMVVALPFGM